MEAFATEHAPVLLGLLSLMTTLVGLFIMQSYLRLCELLREMRQDIKEARKEHRSDRERDQATFAEVFRRLAGVEGELMSHQAECKVIQEHCKARGGERC